VLLPSVVTLRRPIATALTVALAIAASTVVASATTLTDGDFAGTITTTVFQAAGSTASYSDPCPSCGYPDAALEATFTATSPGISDVGFVDHSLSYDPGSLGSIASINASYDRYVTLTNKPFGIGISYRLVIE
jgi:hypothetical protein